MTRSDSRHDQALRSLRTLVQFDVVKVGAAVAEAAAQHAKAQRELSDWIGRCRTTAAELRVRAVTAPVNPALLDSLRNIYRAERRTLEEWRRRLEEARHSEHQLRSKLAELRNRDSSLERALRAQRRKWQLKQQSRQIAVADDLWLQQAWRERI